MSVWYFSNAEKKGWAIHKGKRYSVDEPFLTILAGSVSSDTYGYWRIGRDNTMDAPPLPTPGKPPYTIPTVAEMHAVPWNGYTCVSTFSGGGGSSTGLRMAGFKVLWANEFIEAARDTYRANHPTTPVDGRDIRTVSAADILKETGLARGELDVFEGSPPCSAFSTAGTRSKDWGRKKNYSDGATQVVDDLFFEYARLLDGLQPRCFVAENVSGLVKGVAKGYFLDILARLKACGYKVKAALLDASWLGVPQARQRIIFVGVRNDLAAEPRHPAPLPYRYSVRDALPWLTRVVHDTSGTFSVGDVTDRPAPTVTVGVNSVNSNHFKVTGPPVESESDMSRYATGEEWQKVPVGGQSEKYFQLVRPDPDAPAPTVTAAGGNPGLASVTHPYECRKFSIAEIKRLCSFPDDYVLTGSYAQQWERCGRSVPPLMMRAIGTTIREILDALRGGP